MSRGALGLGVRITCLVWAGCDPNVIVGHESVSSAGSAGQPEPPVPWHARHETGDLEEWTASDHGWVHATRGGTVEVVNEQAHTGSGCLKSSVTTTGEMEQAVVGRRATLAEGYYSAWFFVPSRPPPAGRVIMKLSGGEPYTDIFDITLVRSESGDLRLVLFDHGVAGQISDPSMVPDIPLDTWFEIEAFYRSTPDPDGRVIVWQDGELIVDTGPRITGPNDYVIFIVGSVSENSLPAALVTLVDDAEIRAGEPPPGL